MGIEMLKWHKKNNTKEIKRVNIKAWAMNKTNWAKSKTSWTMNKTSWTMNKTNWARINRLGI